MEEKSLRKHSLVGFPDDLGVKNVNGRPGAAEGPKVFLEYFQKLRETQSMILVPMGQDLEVNHQNAAAQVTETVMQNPSQQLLVVGGGNDYSYSWIKGLKAGAPKNKKIGCINIDAHFDLRPFSPKMTSGSPFRRLIEEKIIDPKHLIEFGIQAHCNAPELWEYARKNKIKTVPFEKLRNGKAVGEFKRALSSLKKQCNQVVISLDLDALSYAFAPGVSAPQAEGFTASEVFQMLEIAGNDKKVISLGIFELSPALDVQNLTARLAAQGAWHFLAGK